MERTRRISTTYLAELSLLVAIIVLMAFTPIGYIKTFGLEITLIVIPVAIGAITLGPKAGAILGATFGFTSFIRGAYGMSAFGMLLFEINPLGWFVTSVITRTLVGWITGVIYTQLKRTSLRDGSIFVASICCPLLNTVLFMSSLVLFFYNSSPVQSIVAAKGCANPFTFVIAFVGINGLVELIACSIIGGIITKRLNCALKRR